jgi:carbonic anhydrase/acetyltransferase-like protein (isoleucine patch superfamily)
VDEPPDPGAAPLIHPTAFIAPSADVLGVPAKIVRPVDEALRARIRDTVEHYRLLARQHRAGVFARVAPL